MTQSKIFNNISSIQPERYKISNMNLYQKVKNHIGQKVDLEIEVTYFYDEDGKRIDKKERGVIRGKMR